MDKQISNNIVESCKKLGIEYHSINPNYVEFISDAQQLGQIYRDLKEIASKLQTISERHEIDNIGKFLQKEIKSIEIIDHDLIKLATKLKNE